MSSRAALIISAAATAFSYLAADIYKLEPKLLILHAMAERTALVTGATGLLGREVVSAFKLLHGGWAVKGTGYSRADGVDILKVNLESAEDVAKTLDETRYALLQLHLVASYNRLGDIYANKSSV